MKYTIKIECRPSQIVSSCAHDTGAYFRTFISLRNFLQRRKNFNHVPMKNKCKSCSLENSCGNFHNFFLLFLKENFLFLVERFHTCFFKESRVFTLKRLFSLFSARWSCKDFLFFHLYLDEKKNRRKGEEN